jgi:HD-GYP domain-containing protein (c-di-GMP phosphodiesterase class II)
MANGNNSNGEEVSALAGILLDDYSTAVEDITAAVSDEPFPDVLSERLAKILAGRLKAGRVSISMREEGVLGKPVLTLKAAVGLDKDIVMDTRTPLDDYGLLTKVIGNGGIIHLSNEQAQRIRPNSLDQRRYSTDSIFALLTCSNGDPMGLISVTNKTGEEQFSSLDLKLLSNFSKLSSLVLAKAVSQERFFQGYVDAVQKRDSYTGGHSVRVAYYAVLMAQRMALPGRILTSLEKGGPLHDTGKIGVPGTTLNKQGELTAEDWEAIHQHPFEGVEILPAIGDARIYSLLHHRRWDGGGYPTKLSGEDVPDKVSALGYPDDLKGADIPIDVRILSAADAFDAMTSNRIYREGMPGDRAMDIINKESGKQFCPDVVAAMNELWNKQRDEMEQIRTMKSDYK